MARDYTKYFVKDADGNQKTILGFSRNGCGTSTHFMQIEKEEYDKLSAMTRGELNRYVEESLTDAQRWGYGFYGAELCQENGMYFLGKCLGNSCD